MTQRIGSPEGERTVFRHRDLAGIVFPAAAADAVLLLRRILGERSRHRDVLVGHGGGGSGNFRQGRRGLVDVVDRAGNDGGSVARRVDSPEVDRPVLRHGHGTGTGEPAAAADTVLFLRGITAERRLDRNVLVGQSGGGNGGDGRLGRGNLV